MKRYIIAFTVIFMVIFVVGKGQAEDDVNINVDIVTLGVDSQAVTELQVGQKYLIEWTFSDGKKYNVHIDLFQNDSYVGEITNYPAAYQSALWELDYTNDNFVTRDDVAVGENYTIKIYDDYSHEGYSVPFSVFDASGQNDDSTDDGNQDDDSSSDVPSDDDAQSDDSSSMSDDMNMEDETGDDLSETTDIDINLTNRLKGKILLQVEQNGEAWYVRPDSGIRVYLKNGDSAYSLMRSDGLGISNVDISKIPVGFEDRFECLDSDSDGLCDKLEDGLGTDANNPDSDGDGYLDGEEVKSGHDPLGSGSMNYDTSLSNRLKGKILLQVETNGEAWYIHPDNGKRYYMPDGPSAYQIMRYLSLGITDSDLAKIAE